MIHETEVLVFTLGLTEAWLSRHDGTVYPTCPGCGSAGDYDLERYRFHNFKASEAIEHLGTAISLLCEANPSIQIILTVSPVPLAATMANRKAWVHAAILHPCMDRLHQESGLHSKTTHL